MTDPVELMTLSPAPFLGARAGGSGPSGFVDRVRSAAKAGFTGIALWHTDLEHIEADGSLEHARTILADNGIKHLELKFLADWFVDGQRRAASDLRRRRLLEASALFGARHIKVGDFHRTATPMPRLVEEFAALCREADDYGATIGFEFMASCMLPSLAGALELVETAGARNGGLIVDIAHVMALGISFADVSRIPRQYLINVELSDGTSAGRPPYDPTRTRRFCGEGDFDIKGFIAAVKTSGYSGRWAAEVFADELATWPLDKLNRHTYATTIAQFAP